MLFMPKNIRKKIVVEFTLEKQKGLMTTVDILWTHSQTQPLVNISLSQAPEVCKVLAENILWYYNKL